MSVHEQYMQRCLDLAIKGQGKVAPNPLVGAILVHKGRIIGEGWHQQFGAAHAEVNCIRSVRPVDRPLIPESTLYVNLEPCCHYGKTPPCTDLILEQRIPSVVIGSRDSYEQVAGGGIEILRKAGVDTQTDILAMECRRVNRRFFTVQEKKRPYIILKWAESVEGYFAPLDRSRKQLSAPASRTLVHKMRSEEAGILVGYNTALNDDPKLNARFWQGNQPVRIVVDLENQLPSGLQVFQPPQRTIIINYHKQKFAGHKEWIRLDHSAHLVESMMNKLTAVQSIIVEGGAKTLQLFIDAGLWDEAMIIKTPVSLGTGVIAPVLGSSRHLSQFPLAEDLVCLQVHEQNEFYL